MRISDWSSDVCSSDLPAPAATPPAPPGAPEEQYGQRDERLQGHIVTPAPTTERLLSIQRMVADQLVDKLPDFEVDALRAIPVQAGGLYPISDVWYIEPGLDAPDRSEGQTSELQSLMR